MTAPPTGPAAPAATIRAAEADAVPWQVVVVGAGPAGGATAWRLARHGLRVLLVDRHEWPRGKVCGCCLSTRAVVELGRLGSGALPAAAVPLAAVRLVHRGRSCRLTMPGGLVVSREALDTALVRGAVAAGSHWLPATAVASIADSVTGGVAIELGAAGVRAGTAGGASVVHADLVILATGLAGHVRLANTAAGSRGRLAMSDSRWIAKDSRIGAGAVLDADACDMPAGELVMAVARLGYCGVVRLENGLIDVAAALDRRLVAGERDPAVAVARLLAEAAGACRLPAPDAIRAAAFRATPPFTRRAAPVDGPGGRVFRVGDAAGYVEPFTGEGIGWALESARLLADSLLAPEGLREPGEASARYVADRGRHLAPLYSRCRTVAAGLRRPAVVATAFAAARAAPWAARRLVPAVIGAARGGAGA